MFNDISYIHNHFLRTLGEDVGQVQMSGDFSFSLGVRLLYKVVESITGEILSFELFGCYFL